MRTWLPKKLKIVYFSGATWESIYLNFTDNNYFEKRRKFEKYYQVHPWNKIHSNFEALGSIFLSKITWQAKSFLLILLSLSFEQHIFCWISVKLFKSKEHFQKHSTGIKIASQTKKVNIVINQKKTFPARSPI